MRRIITALQIAALFMVLGCSSSNKTTPVTPAQVSGPSGLRTRVLNQTAIALSWIDNSDNENGFKIERTLASGNAWTAIATLDPNAVAYNDTGLVEGTAYKYCVYAFLGTTNSATTDSVRAQTSLYAPTGLTATAQSASAIALTWTDASSVETGFQLQRRVSGGTYVSLATLAANATAATDTGLAANTAYVYRLRTIEDTLTSAWSAEATVHTNRLPPNGPTELHATMIGNSSVRLNWRDNAQDEDGYKVERATGGGDNWALLATLNLNATTFTDTGLAEGSDYQYRVYAFLGASNSTMTDPVLVRTSPLNPDGLTAARVSETSISISWSDVSATETAYQVERKTLGGVYQPLATLAANSVALTDTGLAQNTTFVYHVRAMRDTLASAWSNEASARTSLMTPDAPTYLRAQASAAIPNAVILVWTDNSNNENGFILEMSDSRTEGWAVIDSLSADVDSTVVTNLPGESVRYFRLKAYNEHGNSDYTNVATASIAGLPPAPSDLTAQGGMNTPAAAVVNWHDNSLTEDGFVLEMSNSANDGWAAIDSLPAGLTQFRVTNLPSEVTKYFRIYAYNAVGRSDYSNVASTEILGLPLAPSNLTGSAPTYFAALLQWQDNTHSELGFYLERKNHSSFQWARIASIPADTVNYVDSSVVSAHTYDYRIMAYNQVGNSTYSNVATVQTPGSPPGAPSDMIVNAIDVDKIEVSWTDNSNNEDAFFVDRKGPDDADFAFYTVTDPNVGYLLDTALVPETWYAYRVRSSNTAGPSAWAGPDSAQTQSLTYFSDDFESYAADQPPTNPWVLNVGGTSWARVTTSRFHGGQKSFQFNDPDTGVANYAVAYAQHRSVSKGTISLWIYLANGSTWGLRGINAGNSAWTYVVQFFSNDSIQVYDGAAASFVTSYPQNQWFHLEIVFNCDAGTYMVKLNNQAITGDVGYITADQTPLGYMWMAAFSDTAAIVRDGHVDDITIVREWNQGRMETEQVQNPVHFVGAVRSDPMSPLYRRPTLVPQR